MRPIPDENTAVGAWPRAADNPTIATVAIEMIASNPSINMLP